MASINKVILIGRVGRDPETSFSANGNSQITKFSMATSEFYTKNGEKKESTEWHNIVLWNKLADTYKEIIKKGYLIYIDGKIKTNKWTDKDNNTRYRTEVWANNVRILHRTDQQGGGYNQNQNKNDYSQKNNNPLIDNNDTFQDDDIPF